MYKEKFTEKNFNTFLQEHNTSIDDLTRLYKNDADDFFITLAALCDSFKIAFILPYTGFDIEWLLIDAIDNKVNLKDFYVYDEDEEDIEEKNIIVNLNDLDLSVWEKEKVVLGNFYSIVTDIESKNKNDTDDLLLNLRTTADDFHLKGGNICSPKKYIANCPYKLPKGITAIEIRVNSNSSANYRVYGILKNNTIYLLAIDTKTSGQNKADRVFDKFMKDALIFIKKKKLDEEILYNISRGEVKLEENVFKKLDNLIEQQELCDYNNGWNDFCSNKVLNEDAVPNAYIRGYNDAKRAIELEEIRKEMCEKHDEIVKKLKEYRNKKKNDKINDKL